MTELAIVLKRIDKLEELIKGFSQTSENMTIEEAAKYTKLSISTLRRFKKEIGYIQRNRRILFKKNDIDKWLNNNKTQL